MEFSTGWCFLHEKFGPLFKLRFLLPSTALENSWHAYWNAALSYQTCIRLKEVWDFPLIAARKVAFVKRNPMKCCTCLQQCALFPEGQVYFVARSGHNSALLYECNLAEHVFFSQNYACGGDVFCGNFIKDIRNESVWYCLIWRKGFPQSQVGISIVYYFCSKHVVKLGTIPTFDIMWPTRFDWELFLFFLQ